MSELLNHRSNRQARVSLALATLPAVILCVIGVSYLRHEAVIAKNELTRSASNYASSIARQLQQEYEAYLNSEAVMLRKVSQESISQFEAPSATITKSDRTAYQSYQNLVESSSATPTAWREKLPDFKEANTPSGLPLLPLAQLRLTQLYLKQENYEQGSSMLKALLKSVVEDHPSMVSTKLLERTTEIADQYGIDEQIDLDHWIASFKAKSATRRLLYRNGDYLSRFNSPNLWFVDRNERFVRIISGGREILVLSKTELESLAGAALENIIRSNAQLSHPLAFRLHFEKQQIDLAPFDDLTAGNQSFAEKGFSPVAHSGSGEELATVDTLPPFTIRVHAADYPSFKNAVRKKVLRQGAFLSLVMICLGIGTWSTWRTLEAQQALTRRQANLISAISHELRSPVAGIRLMAEGLAKDPSPGNSRERYSKLIAKESSRLGTLIENILDTGRITDGKKAYRFEWTDVDRLVADTVERMRPLAGNDQKTIELHSVGTEVPALVDPVAIQQALGNLIDNALKFSDKGTAVVVSLNPDLKEGVISLKVADKGCGIGSEHQPKIFDLFYRAVPELQREHTGTGLGLHLVKHIVESHGGAVTVDSLPGEGSTFVIELPRETKGAG